MLYEVITGQVTGTLSGNGVVFQIEAQPEDEATIVGTATNQQGRLFFEATIEGAQLAILFVEPA